MCPTRASSRALAPATSRSSCSIRRPPTRHGGGVRGRAFGAETLILLARTVGTAVTIACSAAVLHATTVGRDAFPLVSTAVVLVGVTLVLITVLRERGTVRR